MHLCYPLLLSIPGVSGKTPTTRFRFLTSYPVWEHDKQDGPYGIDILGCYDITRYRSFVSARFGLHSFLYDMEVSVS
jgi:hypothetical protein